MRRRAAAAIVLAMVLTFAAAPHVAAERGGCSTGSRNPDGSERLQPFGFVEDGAVDADPPVVGVTLEEGDTGFSCTPVAGTANVGNLVDHHRFGGPWSLQPCQEGKGSNLPETVVKVSGVSQGIDFNAATATITLGEDMTDPTAKLESSPRPRSQVQVGDRIEIQASGDDKLDGAKSWQWGLVNLRVVGPGGKQLEQKKGPAEPKPCGDKSLQLDTSYKVKKRDAPIVRICVEARDYINRVNPQKCAEYYIGEVWKGKIQGTAHVPTSPPCDAPTSGTFTFGVDHGRVKGTADLRIEFSGLCGGPLTYPDIAVIGTETSSGFQLYPFAVETQQIVLKKHGRNAAWESTSDPSYDWTFTAHCVTCGG